MTPDRLTKIRELLIKAKAAKDNFLCSTYHDIDEALAILDTLENTPPQTFVTAYNEERLRLLIFEAMGGKLSIEEVQGLAQKLIDTKFLKASRAGCSISKECWCEKCMGGIPAPPVGGEG